MQDETTEQARKKALLVGLYDSNANKEACVEYLDELELLVDTYGVDTAEKVPLQVRQFDAATLISTEKVNTIIELMQQHNADLVVFDHEISPAQQRNLEKLIKKTVMDRTEVIIEVFAQRAHTKEARLQIELAKVRYQAPRLKRLWTHLERQAGTAGGGSGGKYLKGAGEKQIEIDKRLLKDRIERLQRELKEVAAYRGTQRSARTRSEIPVFALVGYTNAGKSTLLNALTEAGVFVEDKLFATLDTTTRKYLLPNNQEVLLIDTVGFIRKLPHQLVAAFRGTLEEALHADIIMHVIDTSHPMAVEQAEATLQVLKELKAGDKPVITVLNKIDKIQSLSEVNRFRLKYGKTVSISALNRTGFDELQALMLQEMGRTRKTVTLRIPQSDYAVVTEVIRTGHILTQEYEDNDVVISVSLPTSSVGRLNKYIQEDEAKT
jgi:GTP-binding protein HflX